MNDWKRAGGKLECPICGKKDWCLVSSDKTAAICPRIEAGSKKYIEGSGYLHILKESDKSWPVQSYRFELPSHNVIMADIAKKYMIKSGDRRLARLSDLLGIEEEALTSHWIGYSGSKKGFTFPMFRAKFQVLGIRIRQDGGKKFAVKGSKEGLFIPREFYKDKRPVVVCEGPTDAACCTSFDFRTVGRPSCLGGQKLLVELLEDEHVCILADSDGPGQTGAQKLAEALFRKSKSVSVATPPAKDLREWKNQGCQRQDLLQLIRGAVSSPDTT